MIKLQRYAFLSLAAFLAVIYHAFSSRGQFYPAMVYLSTSKISLVLLLNMGLVNMCILWHLTKRVFLGNLREAEVERLNEQSWREVMEILFAITIFRQDFSVGFLAMVTALLLIKALHWLAQKRVEYFETTPSVPTLSHIRIISFLGFLFVIDSLFLYDSLRVLIQTRQASVSLFFAFEDFFNAYTRYMILATTTVSTFVKYVFYISDMLMEGQWEKKAVYTFYLELIRDLLHLSMYMCFFFAIFLNYGVPLHLIRELYETFRNFKVRIADYLRYRKITSNMNDRFPDATPEELTASDATCIICREEMIAAKKLICGHFFHVHCLRSWLERQHTCPTCRALVVPSDNGANASGGRPPQPDAHQQTVNTPSTSDQGSVGGVADDNLCQHEARLRAAASASSIYGKSFVYPYASTVMGSSGYALLPQAHKPLTDAINTASGSASGLPQQQFINPEGDVNMPVPQFFPTVFVPYQVPETNVASGGRLGCEQTSSGTQLEAQKKFLQCQIEFMRNQLQLLQDPKQKNSTDAGLVATLSDGKGEIGDQETESVDHEKACR